MGNYSVSTKELKRKKLKTLNYVKKIKRKKNKEKLQKNCFHFMKGGWILKNTVSQFDWCIWNSKPANTIGYFSIPLKLNTE